MGELQVCYMKISELTRHGLPKCEKSSGSHRRVCVCVGRGQQVACPNPKKEKRGFSGEPHTRRRSAPGARGFREDTGTFHVHAVSRAS